MKIKEISLTNFAGYENVSVSFDDNVTYLIGKNGAGKSTVGITAIWFILQGIAEKSSNGNSPLIGERFRFIGPKAATAKGEMLLVDEKTGAEIRVMRKLTKTGSELTFEGPEGMELGQQWLNDLFNVFLIAPKKFAELSGIDQAKAIGIDTTQYDKKLADLKEAAKTIRTELKQYDNLVPVEATQRVDITELNAQSESARNEFTAKFQENKQKNKDSRDQWEDAKHHIDVQVREHNEAAKQKRDRFNMCSESHRLLKACGYEGEEVKVFLDEMEAQIKPDRLAANEYPAEPAYIEEMPSEEAIKEIQAKILEAGQTNERALLYEQYLTRKEAKELKQAELNVNKAAQEAVEANRLTYIQSLKLPFSNMGISEDGELLMNGKLIKDPYFSTGELLKIIPILLANGNSELKYVFLQDFNLLDEEKQADVEKYLTSKGFQLVVEMVGKAKIADKNCILLRDNVVVESYETVTEPALAL